jgi:predicted RNase H-like HicB family nuclease
MKTNPANDYAITVAWSHDDDCFVARVPAFRGLSADGETPEAAVAEVRIVLEAAIDIHNKTGRGAPEKDQTLCQVKAMLPLINISKLSLLTKINRQTLGSKLKRGTKFTPDEARRIRKAIDKVMA